MKKIEIRCPCCNKLLAKMRVNGICKNIFLYCRWCREEKEISIMDSETYSKVLERKEEE